MPKVFLDDFLTPQAKAKAMQLAKSKLLRTAAVVVFFIFILATLLRLPTDTLKDLHRSDTATNSGSTHTDHTGGDNTCQGIDWSRYAYVQYVTNEAYLCNSVMIFEALHRLGSKAERLMMYPATFSVTDDSPEGKLLQKAQTQYSVKLMPVQVQSRQGTDPTWAESYTKLLAFNQTQYDRVISLDSDANVLQPMDELFLLPPCPLALPRAYWLNFDDRVLSSQLMLIQPSTFEFRRIMEEIEKAGSNEYDMEIINNLYRDSALILPHRPYDLLTGEFRSTKHADYLGNQVEPWDPEKVLKEAKFLHFSDWPVPKPWISPTSSTKNTMQEKQPACVVDSQTGTEDCRARDIWLHFYSEFRERRQNVCGISGVESSLEKSPNKRGLSAPSPFEPIF